PFQGQVESVNMRCNDGVVDRVRYELRKVGRGDREAARRRDRNDGWTGQVVETCEPRVWGGFGRKSDRRAHAGAEPKGPSAGIVGPCQRATNVVVEERITST